MPLRKKYKRFNWSKYAYQTSKNLSNFHVFWSIWWCLVCSFSSILKLLFILFFVRVWRTKKGFFGSILSQWKLNNCVGNTLENKVQNTHFKIGQKLHTKHQKIDHIFMFFDRFDDVWYAVFDQFWNFYLCCFPQVYSVQKTCFLAFILSQSKSNNFVRNTFEKKVQNIYFKIGQNLHTKHQKMNQMFMFFDRFFDVWYAVFDQFWNSYWCYFPQGYCQQNVLIFIDSKWIQISLFLYAIPLREIRWIKDLKLIKNCIPNIIKSIKKHKNLIDFVMFGIHFLREKKGKKGYLSYTRRFPTIDEVTGINCHFWSKSRLLTIDRVISTNCHCFYEKRKKKKKRYLAYEKGFPTTDRVTGINCHFWSKLSLLTIDRITSINCNFFYEKRKERKKWVPRIYKSVSNYR